MNDYQTGLQNQLLLNRLNVGLVDQRGMRQTTLAIGCLFGQDVTLEGMLALDLSSAGQLEALLCAGLGFHLRHSSFDLGLLIISF